MDLKDIAIAVALQLGMDHNVCVKAASAKQPERVKFVILIEFPDEESIDVRNITEIVKRYLEEQNNVYKLEYDDLKKMSNGTVYIYGKTCLMGIFKNKLDPKQVVLLLLP